MQFPINNILIVPSKNHFMNEIGDFVTVYTQIPRSNLKPPVGIMSYSCEFLFDLLHLRLFNHLRVKESKQLVNRKCYSGDCSVDA